MKDSYWQTLNARINRRRVLVAGGGAAAGAALLAACGGSSSGSGTSSSAPKSSLVQPATDTSKQAKRGGALKTTIAAPAVSHDPHLQGGAALSTVIPLTVSRLTILKAGYMKGSDGEFIGDLAESYEVSPDRLQMTFKLRQNAAFAPTAPVNGRLVDAQDILFSWDRFSKIGAARTDLVNSLNPGAPITSVTSPDAQTIVIKLAQPDATIAASLSAPQSGRFNIVPREIDSKYDPRGTLIGSGPYYLAEYTPSVRYVFKRNPGYYDAAHPNFDSLEYPFIPEYATASSEFKAGQIYSFGLGTGSTQIKQEDILQFKQDVPDLVLSQSDLVADATGGRFGYRNTDKGVFRDERLRQAWSMAMDRDLWLEVIYNVSKLQQQGLTVSTRWNSAAQADDFEGWWLDPKSKDFGPNAKYFQHDVAEAKKLIAAAGYNNGVNVISNSAPNGYDSIYPKHIDIFQGMAADAGFSFTANVVDYTQFQPKYRDNHGDFEGIAYGPLLTLNTDAVGHMAGLFLSTSGATFLGFDPDGKGNFAGDSHVDDEIKKARLETDSEKRRQIMLDLQRYLGARQYVYRYPGGASGFRLTWPVLKNVGVYHNEPRPWYWEWLDETQKPISSK